MPDSLLTRRTILIAGTAAAIAGCTGQERRDSDPTATRWERPGIAPGTGFWYTVVAGENVVDIARRAQVPIGDITATNNLHSLSVAAGQRLWIPGVPSFPGSTPTPTASPTSEPQAATPIQELPGNGYVLVPRATWTKEPVGRNNNAMGKVLRLTVHHTGEHIGLKGLPDIEIISRIEHYHRTPAPNGRGWAAIGYHFLVGKDGRIYEGRPAQFQGAHVSGGNENNLGISVIGDFNHARPSPRQLAALSAFLSDKRAQYRVSKNRVFGHRDLGRSECPGDALYGWLKSQGFTKNA